MTPPERNRELFTIGYGAREIDEYLALLRKYSIEYLVDSRSQPHSRYKREFNREVLARVVEAAGIRYLFMGDAIGGRPSDETCYPSGRIEGRPDYAIVQTRPWFIAGIERLERGLEQGHRIAVMCAEQRPEVCHRTHLISDALAKRGVRVRHIDETGQLQSHQAIVMRAVGDQPTLF